MIVYDLKCRKDHVFEAWFPDSASFAEQVKGGKVLCPVCGSKKVSKALMAPNVNTGGSRAQPAAEDAPATQGLPAAEGVPAAMADAQNAGELRGMLRALREHVESNCDYVGGQFAEEARKIHYGETEARGIYGETSDDEAATLADEGIDVQRIPWIRREDS